MACGRPRETELLAPWSLKCHSCPKGINMMEYDMLDAETVLSY